MNLRTLIPSFLVTGIAFLGGRRNREQTVGEANWGREVKRDRDMGLIALYHDGLPETQKRIDDRTWQDLGMDELFAKIDRTAGMPGRQVLCHQMRTYEEDDIVLTERTRQQTIFRDDAGMRREITSLLARLNKPGATWIAPLLLNPLPAAPRYAGLLHLSGLLPVLCLVGLVFFPPLILVSLLLFFVNLFINATYGARIAPHFGGFTQIDSLLSVGEKLGAISDSHQLPQLAYLRTNAPMIAALRKQFGWLLNDRSSGGDIGQAVLEYLNIFFLLDIRAFLRSLKGLREHRETLVRIFGEVGSLDASISVASYVAGAPGIIVPDLADDRRLEVTGLCHPLIPAPVGNPLVLSGRSALVSGSNMSGKTTFIRTIGINLLLARTLAICHAESAVFPRAIVRSAIRREDSLSDGESYFFAELKQIQDFIEAAAGEVPHLFLIDEIFRGTNTIERISASTAVLRHLARRQMVLVTTHDLELQELLADGFDMYHFSERFADGKCLFDYRIHPGPAHSRNALKLMSNSGYPAAIVKEAEILAEKLAVRFQSGNATFPQPT
ncbi:MAG TPA: hypothetical protein VGM64_20970 [Lacunisphaera sp.]